MLTTMFTFMGTEIVTIAAAESPDPEHGIRKAVNSVIWRISLFYLGSIFVVVALVAVELHRAWSSAAPTRPSSTRSASAASHRCSTWSSSPPSRPA